MLSRSDPPSSRARMRLISVGWALTAAALTFAVALLVAATLALWRLAGPADGLEAGLRSAGCGFFYGLLAFHLQRVDPDDGHLQAGLVGAICGIRSLGAPLDLPAAAPQEAPLAWLKAALPGLLLQWLPLWLPLVGAALALPLALRRWPVLRPQAAAPP